MLLQINDLIRPVAVDGAPEIVEVLRSVTAGWTFRSVDGASAPSIRLCRRGGRYVIGADLRHSVVRERSAVSAACSLVVDIAEALADSRPDMLCLHAGAVRIGSGLVVFPSRRRAGKSTLIARLASLGAEVFADDVLPLVAADGMLDGHSLGVASRLRLPLPPAFSPEFRRYCEVQRGPEDAYYRYLEPAKGSLAPYGRRAPIHAFVFLDRGPDDAPASLFRVDRAAAMEALLLQNFGFAASAGEILDRFERLTCSAGPFVLRYGALDPAARLVIETFAARPGTGSWPKTDLPLPPWGRRANVGRPMAPGPLMRAPGIAVRPIDGRPFLVDDDNGAVFALDGVGHVVWELLAYPVSPAEIGTALGDAFPDVPRPVIRRDVDAFLRDLVDRRLVYSSHAQLKDTRAKGADHAHAT